MWKVFTSSIRQNIKVHCSKKRPHFIKWWLIFVLNLRNKIKNFWGYRRQSNLCICSYQFYCFTFPVINLSFHLIALKQTLQSGEGNFTKMYKDIDLTTYDSDVYSTDVNETMDDDWDSDLDPLYAIEQVFGTVFFSIDRYSNRAMSRKWPLVLYRVMVCSLWNR